MGVVNADSSTESYSYSGDSQRRSKNSIEGEVLYVWDAENVLEELEGNGELMSH